MSFELLVNIENQYVEEPTLSIRTTSDYPVIKWFFSPISSVDIDEYKGEIIDIDIVGQYGYEIRISDNDIFWGQNNFGGNKVHTGFIINKDRFWNYTGMPLERGTTYYGQINVQDEFGRTSGWNTFSFQYNSLPLITNVGISPSQPTISDNLVLSYDYFDMDGDEEQRAKIRWFKNGVYQKQLDGLKIVDSRHLSLKDIWMADIVVFDGYEYSERVSSPVATITKTAPVVSSIKISPSSPNENDILRADFDLDTDYSKDNSEFRWFVNGSLVSKYNDQRYIRPDVFPGNTVRFEVRAEGSNTFLSSPLVTIASSDFKVYNITIDGHENPLDILSKSPVIRWKVFSPANRVANYLSIKIGRFYGAEDIYSTEMFIDNNQFVIPNDILEKGVDYYVAISVSDTESFDNYSYARFRLKGSRWSDKADNETGWTIETLFAIETNKNNVSTFNESFYHTIQIHDGTKYSEIRIFNERIALFSNQLKYSDMLDTSGVHVLTVRGQNNNIYVYLDRKLIIDGTGIMTQTSSHKMLLMGNNSGNDFHVKYKYVYYTIQGDFDPTTSEEFSAFQFYPFLTFKDNEIVSLKGSLGTYDTKIFAINPDDLNQSGEIYSIRNNESYNVPTVPRTFAPITRMKTSPDGKKKIFSHYKGVTIVEGYEINPFSYTIEFLDGNGNITNYFPNNYGWDLIQNMGEKSAAYFDEDGFHINTLQDFREIL